MFQTENQPFKNVGKMVFFLMLLCYQGSGFSEKIQDSKILKIVIHILLARCQDQNLVGFYSFTGVGQD